MAHLITCTECKKQLQVPEDLLGQQVQCPECKHTFTAELPGEKDAVTSSPAKKTVAPPSVPTKRAAWDKKPAAEKDDDEDRKDKKKTKKRRDEDDDDDRPSRRRSRRSRRGQDYAPHRGGMILAFGIIGLVSGLGIIFGPIAWMMGNTDLKEMEAGRMDPEGQGITQVGRILGMIATIMSIVGILLGCGIFVIYFVIIVLVIGAAAANANKNFPPPQPPRRF
jgi:hypothetical protein